MSINAYDRKLKLKDARDLAQQWDSLDSDEFARHRNKWKESTELSPAYKTMRDALVDAYNDALENYRDYGMRQEYCCDVLVGLEIYSILKPTLLSQTLLADDDFWRYISMIVIPDITYDRYPKPDKSGGANINAKRFYSHTRRIWIKTLWWYIHLSWQGNEQATMRALKNLSTDAISQFVERTGIGYRVEACRAVIGTYGNSKGETADLSAQVAKVNLAQYLVFEPSLVEGGEISYASNVVNPWVER